MNLTECLIEGKANPNFEVENKNRLAVLHPMLIDAGKYFQQRKLYEKMKDFMPYNYI